MVRKLRSEPAANLVHSLMKSVDDFVGDAPQFDDLTALAATLIAKKSARDVERAASGSTVSVPIAS